MQDFPPAFPAPEGSPDGAVVVAPGQLDFLHVGRVTVADVVQAPDIWAKVMARPIPGLGLAFRLRDALSSRFGVQRIGGFSHGKAMPHLGERLDFFLVEDLTPQRMVLTARDRHLDVMVAATANPVSGGTEIGLTASVITHNRFGRAYMIPVAPAHRVIVWLMLRRLKRTAVAASAP